MIRTYAVKYKSKSKMLTTQELIDSTKQTILDETCATDVEIKEDGQVISIEADEDKFPEVMNTVVNVFRRIDDKSEVSYKFNLNM